MTARITASSEGERGEGAALGRPGVHQRGPGQGALDDLVHLLAQLVDDGPVRLGVGALILEADHLKRAWSPSATNTPPHDVGCFPCENVSLGHLRISSEYSRNGSRRSASALKSAGPRIPGPVCYHTQSPVIGVILGNGQRSYRG